MSLVDVHNEWDALEEIVVGTATGARLPMAGVDSVALAHNNTYQSLSGPFRDDVIAETELELEELCDELTRLGVKVRRPEPRDHAAVIATPDWRTDGLYDYCPRDGFLTVGNTIIETPMILRSRFLEGFAYRELFLEYFASGARWLSAPKPRLLDEMYDMAAQSGQRLRNLEPAFDAANVLRFGTDILYLVSDGGNELGCQWLQSTLGDEYTVHPCRGLYSSTHVDSTLIPLRPGLMLVNPTRVTDDSVPEFLRGWDRVVCPEPVDTGYVGAAYCSVWVAMNLLVVAPGRVIVDRRQVDLIRELDKHGVEVLPLQLTHARTLGGGFHCVTLDVRRAGSLETYR
jgi:glycine amidinotransferase/scyllo-inosamine-4-phosphate amidinotransferase 1